MNERRPIRALADGQRVIGLTPCPECLDAGLAVTPAGKPYGCPTCEGWLYIDWTLYEEREQ